MICSRPISIKALIGLTIMMGASKRIIVRGRRTRHRKLHQCRLRCQINRARVIDALIVTLHRQVPIWVATIFKSDSRDRLVTSEEWFTLTQQPLWIIGHLVRYRFSILAQSTNTRSSYPLKYNWTPNRQEVSTRLILRRWTNSKAFILKNMQPKRVRITWLPLELSTKRKNLL